jgi:hypothetical protein
MNYKHRIKILKEEQNIPCHEYIYKYILMYGSCIIKNRTLKRINELEFDVEYEFFDNVTEEIIQKHLNNLQ